MVRYLVNRGSKTENRYESVGFFVNTIEEKVHPNVKKKNREAQEKV